jgi:ribosomal protein L11
MPKGDNPNSRKGIKNLIPLNKRSKETQRAIQRMGAAASNAKQARAKTFAEELRILLEAEITNGKGEKVTTRKAISTALVKKAIQGDKGAYEQIRDTVGEKPTDRVEQVVITPEVDFEKLAALRKALRDDD